MTSFTNPANANSSQPATIESSWLEIERIDASIHAAAAAQSWDRVVEGATARHQSLQRHFATFPVGPTNAGFYQKHLTKMLSGEQTLHALAVDARRQIMRESASANYNHRAMSAYLS